MKFKILSILILIFLAKTIFCEERVILYVSDNIHLGDNFVTKYADMLQTLMDDNYGKNVVKLKKFSKFDFNTTDCFEFLKSFNTRNYLPKTVIITIGEANQYNLRGFSSYLSKRKNAKPKKTNNKTLKRINEEIMDIYEQKNSLLKIAGKQMFSNGKTEYKPKIVPNFYALNDKFIEDPNMIASVSAYSYAWELIRAKKYNQARDFLFNIISKKSSHSMFYYALGSLYLLEQKENAETNALKIFEEGILVDMRNSRNMCYKGLIYVYMSYKGDISNDILYFARAVYEVAGDVSEEITTITTLNTSNYEIKHQTILDWALSDLDKIKELYAKNNINLVFAGYPDELKINEVVKNHIEESNDGILFFQNRFEFTGNMDYSLYNLSKKMFSFLKDRKFIK
jgi:hypothetical protein